jgi:hypothetical protein
VDWRKFSHFRWFGPYRHKWIIFNGPEPCGEGTYARSGHDGSTGFIKGMLISTALDARAVDVGDGV